MNGSIRFPNLGIEVAPGNYISVFGFHIAYYGIIIGIGMLVGALIAYREARKTHQNVEDYIDFTLYTLIAAIVGARAYYVVFEWDYYSKYPLQIFNLRAGGLAIYGGIIASVLTLFIFTKVKKLNFWLMADTAIQGLVVGQVIGRWGNFFNREAFGGYTDSLFAMQIPVNEAKGLTADLLSKVKIVDGIEYIQVHPTFLYEGTWNLCLFIVLCLFKRHKKFDGEIFALYLLGYGVGRFFIEGLRTDQLVIKSLGLPASQLLSAVLVVGSLSAIIIMRIKLAKRNKIVKSEDGQNI